MRPSIVEAGTVGVEPVAPRARRTDYRALLPALAISAVTGYIGAEAIAFAMLQQRGVGGISPTIASMITWAILARYVSNRSLPRALAVGLFSPILGAIIGLPLFLAGIYWAIAMIRYWWITIPIALMTSVLVQLVSSRYEEGYSPWPRVAALAGIVAIVAAAAFPRVQEVRRDPLRESAAAIRDRLVAATPLGSSPDAVIRALGTTIPYDEKEARKWPGSPPAYRREPGSIAVEHFSVHVAVAVGSGHIQTTLGRYATPRGPMVAYAVWAFDSSDRLIAIYVRKYPLFGS